MITRLLSFAAVCALLFGACDSGDTNGPERDSDAVADVMDVPDGSGGDPELAVAFPEGFRLGVATSAHQIEGGNTNNWSLWETLPLFVDHVVEPSGLATDHYNRFEEDLDLVVDLGADVFRFSIEWSRVEPVRGEYDDAEVAHYRAVLEAAEERGITPSVTLHHFTEPTWFVDLTSLTDPIDESFCQDGPSDDDLCFWGNRDAVDAFAAFCGRMAAEYGDLVDEWMTINELTGYWIETVVVGDFPPGLTASTRQAVEENALPVLEGLMDAHAACYAAIHEADTIDSDGDGTAARVGLTIGTGNARPADPDDAGDVAAAEQAFYLASFHTLDGLIDGRFDADFDAEPESDRPEWAGTVDLIGLQYYASTVVIDFSIHPILLGTPCTNTGDEGLLDLQLAAGCPPPPTDEFPLADDEPHRVFGRQHDPEGLVDLLTAMHERYPSTPIVITENGFANDDEVRATSIARHLRACGEAIAAGVPLEGYYHWSLLDNFEWGRGFDIRFGLYHVAFDDDLTRTPTAGADAFREIATARGVPTSMLPN